MLRSLGVSLAQVVAAAVVLYGCVTASLFGVRANDGPASMADGVPYAIAAIVLVPLSAMIVGPLVASRLRLAKPGGYGLSVAAVVLIMIFVSISGSSFANAPFTIIILTAANLLIGSMAGMRRERLR